MTTAAAIVAVVAAFGAGFCAGWQCCFKRFTYAVVMQMRRDVLDEIERRLADDASREP